MIKTLSLIYLITALLYAEKSFSEYRRAGFICSNQKNYTEAIYNFTKAIELNPTYYDIYTGRGCAYSESKQYDKALADFAKAIDISPDNSIAYQSRGMLYKTLGKNNKALSDFEKAISLTPTDPSLYYCHALTIYDNTITKEYPKALQMVHKAISLLPYINAYYALRGKLNYELNDYPKAIVDLNRYILNEKDTTNINEIKQAIKLIKKMGAIPNKSPIDN